MCVAMLNLQTNNLKIAGSNPSPATTETAIPLDGMPVSFLGFRLLPIEYAPGTLVRQVHHNGEVKWRGPLLYLSEVFAQAQVGFTPIGETAWAVHYSFHPLWTLDERTLTITSARQWHQPDDPQAR